MIYFIEAVGADMVKIGFTDGDPDVRRKALQTGCPHQLRVRATMSGEQRDEGDLHAMFAHLRESGEWFRLEGELRFMFWLIPRMFDPLKRLQQKVDALEKIVADHNDWLYPDAGETDVDDPNRCAIEGIDERIDCLECDFFTEAKRLRVLETVTSGFMVALEPLLTKPSGIEDARRARGGDCRA